jgi:type II secretory pathway component PulF
VNNLYAYQAVDASGRTTKGTVEAESLEEASSGLTSRGMYVLKISQSSNLSVKLAALLGRRRVTREEIIDLANNLSVMVGAGIPLLTSLGDISNAVTNPALQSVLAEIKQGVEQGSSFSDALEPHARIFPDVFRRLVKVGEETGRFEKSLADIAEHLQRMENLSGAIKRALIYPVFAIVTTMGALAFWMIYVLPKIIDTLKGLGVKLPFLTRMLIVSSNFSQRFWYLGILFPILVIVVIKLMKRTERGLYLVDLMKLKFPVYKLIEYNRLLALFAEQSRILIVSGLTVDRTLGIVSEVMGNDVFRRAISAIREDITYGSTIADAIKRQNVFPTLMVRMIGVGESSGTLDDQFGFLASHYLKKLDDVSEKLGKIIEPLVITTVGVLFAVIISGLLLPVYDLVSKVGKG